MTRPYINLKFINSKTSIADCNLKKKSGAIEIYSTSINSECTLVRGFSKSNWHDRHIQWIDICQPTLREVIFVTFQNHLRSEKFNIFLIRYLRKWKLQSIFILKLSILPPVPRSPFPLFRRCLISEGWFGISSSSVEGKFRGNRSYSTTQIS